MNEEKQYIVMPLEDYQNTCDKIREKVSDETILITSGKLSENIEKVYNIAYEKAALEREKKWWNDYQQNGERTNYINAFFNFGWTDVTYNPQYSINSTSSFNMFAWSDITDTKVPIKISDAAAASSVFNNCKKLVTIVSLDIDAYNQTYTNWFTNCVALQNINIIGYFKKNISFKDSTELTKESIINIINALDPNGLLSNELTLTLSKVAVDKAFEEIFEAGSKSNILGSETKSWLDLKLIRPNWRIELV